jgi:pSer/pThr/pTyr-binding forkhead associated (FHA) protein
MRAQGGGTPYLVVQAPESDRGRQIPLDKDYLVVGREQSCDVRFDDPSVSRTHAALRRRGNAVYVEDLGSTAGTLVNGTKAVAARELHAGDLLTFASVVARLESLGFDSAQTITTPARPAGAGTVHYVRQQHGGLIAYDERQYNSHVQYLKQQRDNLLREVAATRTKARWLVWTGLTMLVLGSGIFAAVDLNFLKPVSKGIQNPGSVPPTDPFARSAGGIPIGLIGFAMAAAGMLLLIVGIALHVVATSRGKQAHRKYPVLPPWAGPDAGR